jgi:hypothetical protein
MMGFVERGCFLAVYNLLSASGTCVMVLLSTFNHIVASS